MLFPDGMQVDTMELLDGSDNKSEFLKSSVDQMLNSIQKRQENKKNLTQRQKDREEFKHVSGMVDGWLDERPFIIDEYSDVCEPAEELEGTNTTGSELPRYMRQDKGKSLF